MESTPGKRLQQWREFKGLSITDMFRATGVKVSTLSTAEQPGSSNPSYDTISKVLAAYPDLNPDWLLLGTGEMLRGGRVLTPAPKLGPTTGLETVAQADTLIQLARAERLAKEALKARPNLYRGRRTWALEQCIWQALATLDWHAENEPDLAPEDVDSYVLEAVDEYLYESTHS